MAEVDAVSVLSQILFLTTREWNLALKLSLTHSQVNRARAALHSGFDGAISEEPPLCRECQYEALSSFIRTCFETCQGGGVYLSGVPGTGKKPSAVHKPVNGILCLQNIKQMQWENQRE